MYFTTFVKIEKLLRFLSTSKFFIKIKTFFISVKQFNNCYYLQRYFPTFLSWAR